MIGAQPSRLPLSIGDPSLVSGALSVVSMFEIFAYYLQRGYVSVGFMGGAQIDRFGNVNATVIGSYEHPKVRLPGSGGSMEIAAWADRCYFHDPASEAALPRALRFPHLGGLPGGAIPATALGLRGGGPAAVVTDLGVIEPDENGELVLTAVHPGIEAESARRTPAGTVELAALRSADRAALRRGTRHPPRLRPAARLPELHRLARPAPALRRREERHDLALRSFR